MIVHQTKRYIALSTALVFAVLTASCGGGSSSAPEPARTPAPASAAPSAPIAQGLLTNDQLQTINDDNKALVDEDVASWFAVNADIVRSLTEDQDFSDLAFLDQILENKRLVMLGESSHGVEEYSQAKVRMIKYLHEELGYNVLAFESGLFECENVQQNISSLTSRAAMVSCLFGVWHTQTLVELFDYVKQRQSTSNPLRITGFDVQASSPAFRQRADNTEDMAGKVSPDYALDVRLLEDQFRTLTESASTAENANQIEVQSLIAALPDLTAEYAMLADYLRANIALITQDGQFSQRDVLIAAQYAETSPYYAEQLSQRFDTDFGIRARDKGMAENLIALSTEIYPEDKIIGWAHNAHLRHQGTGLVPDANMGALVHNELEADLYTIGFYMYRGQHAFNDRSIRSVNAPMDYSLEAIFHSRRLAYLFLDISGTSGDEAASWLRLPVPTWAWGSTPLTLTLDHEYDGVFIIDTASPPDYL